ncbi:MAG: hypothetical protein PVG53_03860, partial [Holophagae bacterium]
MQHFGLRQAATISAGLGVFLLASVLSTGVGWAQEVAADDPVPEAVPEPAPPYPADLDDLSISVDELQLRLVPLTADQLAPLAAAWLDHAQ